MCCLKGVPCVLDTNWNTYRWNDMTSGIYFKTIQCLGQGCRWDKTSRVLEMWKLVMGRWGLLYNSLYFHTCLNILCSLIYIWNFPYGVKKKKRQTKNRILPIVGTGLEQGRLYKRLNKILTGTWKLVACIVVFHSCPIFLSGIIFIAKKKVSK